MASAPSSKAPPKLSAGQRIRVTQRIVGRDQTWRSRVEGVILSCQEEPTGSWFAHGRHARLWLLRIRLQKPDGEVTALSLDDHSDVEILDSPRG